VNAHIFNRFIREGSKPTAKEIQIQSDNNLVNAIKGCEKFLQKWKSTRETQALMRLVLHRLGFVVYDTEDSRIVYTLFEVLNSRGLAVDWLDKTKSVLMGKTYELCGSQAATQAEIETLQKLWSQIYQVLGNPPHCGDHLLRSGSGETTARR